MAKTNPNPTRLVRGIDPIPPRFEIASGYAAIAGLARSATTLKRLATAAEKAGDTLGARELRRCESAVRRGLDHITGGFEVAYIEPLAARLREAEKSVRLAS